MFLIERPYRVAMVVPLSGPGGIFGPSCLSLSRLAAHELNQTSGIGGRQVELIFVDAGRHPTLVAAEVGTLVSDGHVDAVSGWHISSVRTALLPVLAGRVPYVYTSLYEGGEHASGVYCSGETPEQQLLPALKWLRDELGVRRWFVAGADYSWPLHSFHRIRRFAEQLGLEITGSAFVKMGGTDVPALVRRIASVSTDGVLMMFVGQDAVAFNRAFAELGLHDRFVRLSPLMDENMLLAGGEDAALNLFSSAAYFRSLTASTSLDLVDRYVHHSGPTAPALNNMAQSCYQGLLTLAALARRSSSFRIGDFDRGVDGLNFESPRGEVRFLGNQALQTVHLARAERFDFSVVHSF